MSLISLMLNQTVEWLPQASVPDAFGDSVMRAPEEIACRISYKNRLVINSDGREVRSGAQITTLAKVEIGDRIRIDGVERPVIEVTRPVTAAGNEHRRKVFI